MNFDETRGGWDVSHFSENATDGRKMDTIADQACVKGCGMSTLVSRKTRKGDVGSTKAGVIMTRHQKRNMRRSGHV